MSDIPSPVNITSNEMPFTTPDVPPPFPKKRLFVRHPRLDRVDHTEHVFNISRYAQPINALTPSKLVSTSRHSHTLPFAIPDAVVKSFAFVEPLLPVLFPLGLVSAALQSLPMVISVLPLAILAGLAGSILIPIICLGGMTVSTYLIARAVTKILFRHLGLAKLKALNLVALSKVWSAVGLTYGLKGGKALKTITEVFVMGTIALGALASLNPEARAQSRSRPPTHEARSTSSRAASSMTSSDSVATPEKRSRTRPKSSARVNFVDDLPTAPPATNIPLPPSTPPSPQRGSAKAQSIFQSLLLAPNNQTLAYDSMRGSSSTEEDLAITPNATAPPQSNALSAKSLLTPPTSNPASSPADSLRQASLDMPEVASPSSYFTSSHRAEDEGENDLPTPTSVSTPGYTPMTPMTPVTPHLQASYQNLTKIGKSVSFADELHLRDGHPLRSRSASGTKLASTPYAVSGLQAALEKLNSQQLNELQGFVESLNREEDQ